MSTDEPGRVELLAEDLRRDDCTLIAAYDAVDHVLVLIRDGEEWHHVAEQYNDGRLRMANIGERPDLATAARYFIGEMAKAVGSTRQQASAPCRRLRGRGARR